MWKFSFIAKKDNTEGIAQEVIDSLKASCKDDEVISTDYRSPGKTTRHNQKIKEWIDINMGGEKTANGRFYPKEVIKVAFKNLNNDKSAVDRGKKLHDQFEDVCVKAFSKYIGEPNTGEVKQAMVDDVFTQMNNVFDQFDSLFMDIDDGVTSNTFESKKESKAEEKESFKYDSIGFNYSILGALAFNLNELGFVMKDLTTWVYHKKIDSINGLNQINTITVKFNYGTVDITESYHKFNDCVYSLNGDKFNYIVSNITRVVKNKIS